MKLFYVGKDGGIESTVTGYWLIESKRLFSICLLKFDGASRNAYHTHAFNAISWILKGGMTEQFIDGRVKRLLPSIKPFITLKTDFHKVSSDNGVSWALTFRGPWDKNWKEYLPEENRYRTLCNGRKEVSE